MLIPSSWRNTQHRRAALLCALMVQSGVANACVATNALPGTNNKRDGGPAQEDGEDAGLPQAGNSEADSGNDAALPSNGDASMFGGADAGSVDHFPLPEGRLVYHRYSAYEAGDSEMFVVQLPSGERSDELGSQYALCNLMNGIFSPDGHSLVVMGQARDGSGCGPTVRSEFDIYILDLSRSGHAMQVTNNALADEDPQFTPAGDAVLFKHDGHLARWAVGSVAFTSCAELEAGSLCFAADGGEQSKPVLSGDGTRLCYWEGSGANADVFCADLARAMEGVSLDDLRVPVAANAGIEDYFPVATGPYIYYARWRASDNKANVIERRNLSDLTQEAGRAQFCTDEQRDYSDPCSMGDGWLAFSTTEGRVGGYDLFLSRFDGSGKQSLDALVPGLNSIKNELGASFLHR